MNPLRAVEGARCRPHIRDARSLRKSFYSLWRERGQTVSGSKVVQHKKTAAPTRLITDDRFIVEWDIYVTGSGFCCCCLEPDCKI